VLAGGQRLADRGRDDHHRQAGVGAVVRRQPRQRGLGLAGGGEVDDDHPDRAALPRLHRLERQVAEARRVGLGQAVRREAADHDDLALDRLALVVVDGLLALGRLAHDPEAHVDRVARDRLRRRHRGRRERVDRDRGAVDRQRGRGPARHRDRDLEGLQELAAGQAAHGAQIAQLADQPLLGVVEADRADPAPLAGVVGQVADRARRVVGRRRGDRAARVVDPLGDEDVGVAVVAARRRRRRAAVRRERQALAVRGEHREAVEALGVGDALEVGAADVDRPDVEVAAARVGDVGGEQDPLARRMEERRERRRVQVGHLPRVAAVGVGHPDLELGRPHQVLGQERLVVGELGAGRPRRAPHDLRAVGREERAAVVARARR
jgi:hypothetical protein